MLRTINEEIPLAYGLTDKETTLLEGILAGFINVKTGNTSRVFYKNQPYDTEYEGLKNKLPDGSIEISGNGIRFNPKILSSGIPCLTFELYTNGLYDHNMVDAPQKKIIGHNVYNGWNNFVGYVQTHIENKIGNWLYVGCKFNQKYLIRTMHQSVNEANQDEFDLDEFIQKVKDQVYEFHSAITPIWEKISIDLSPRKFGQTQDSIYCDLQLMEQSTMNVLNSAHPQQFMQYIPEQEYGNGAVHIDHFYSNVNQAT